VPTGDMKGLGRESKPPMEGEEEKKRGKEKEKRKRRREGGLRGLWLKWQMKTAPQLRGRTKAQ